MNRRARVVSIDGHKHLSEWIDCGPLTHAQAAVDVVQSMAYARPGQVYGVETQDDDLDVIHYNEVKIDVTYSVRLFREDSDRADPIRIQK